MALQGAAMRKNLLRSRSQFRATTTTTREATAPSLPDRRRRGAFGRRTRDANTKKLLCLRCYQEEQHEGGTVGEGGGGEGEGEGEEKVENVEESLLADEHTTGEEAEEASYLQTETLSSQLEEGAVGIDTLQAQTEASDAGAEATNPEAQDNPEEVARIMALVEQVTQLEARLKDTRSLNSVEYRSSIKKMRKSVEELQRELVRQELQVVIREVESDINAEEEEFDQLLEESLGIDQQTVEYVVVALSTLALSSLAWSFEFFVLEEDTSWWWSLPKSVADTGVWASVVAAPALLIGLTQIESLKQNFVDPALTAYLEQNFTDNLDQLKVLLADFKYVAEDRVARENGIEEGVSDGDNNKTEEEEEEDISYFISYLMLDVSILGSEMIILLGFVQGLMLKYLGAIGWKGSTDAWQQLQIPDLASTSMGTLVDTSSLSAWTAGPFVILSIAAFILAIEVQVNELEKNEPELLSDLLYNNNSGDLLESISYESTVFGWNHSELRPLLSYLFQIKNSLTQKGKDDKKRLTERMWGQERARGSSSDMSANSAAVNRPYPPTGVLQSGLGTFAEERVSSSDLAAKRLSTWQLNFHAKKKYMWVETMYWIYLTSEVYFMHSLVPSILTALGIEAFSWAKLWSESRKANRSTKET